MFMFEKYKIRDLFTFFREIRHVGAISPTSNKAAQAVISQIRKSNRKPMAILEVGAGNGAVTIPILENMIEGDKLTICEISPQMMRSLKTNLVSHPLYEKRKGQISFHLCPAQDLPENEKYDAICCAIPFLVVNPEIVKEILSKFSRLCNDGGFITFIEYIGMRKVSRMIFIGERSSRMKALEKLYQEFMAGFAVSRDTVWLNIFPLAIFHLQK